MAERIFRACLKCGASFEALSNSPIFVCGKCRGLDQKGAERTCGQCRWSAKPIGVSVYSERRLCCAPLPMVVDRVVYVSQIQTSEFANATECNCFDEKEADDHDS